MDKRKIRGIQISAGHSIHYFQVSDGEVSMTVDCIHGNCIITEKELLSYLQSRNSRNNMRTVTRDGEVVVIDNYNPPVSLRMTVSEAAMLRDGIEAAIMDYDARQDSGGVVGGQGTANTSKAEILLIKEKLAGLMVDWVKYDNGQRYRTVSECVAELSALC